MSDEHMSSESTVKNLTTVESKDVDVDAGPAPETLPAEDCTIVSTYNMRPAFRKAFPLPAIKFLINSILVEKLKGQNYNPNDAGKLVRHISDEINTRIKDVLPVQRFKHVVQVVIGQQLGAGCHYIAKCCWDADSDSHVTDVFSNTSLFCVCTVFGIFQY